jgi:hypothetical protein
VPDERLAHVEELTASAGQRQFRSPFLL